MDLIELGLFALDENINEELRQSVKVAIQGLFLLDFLILDFVEFQDLQKGSVEAARQLEVKRLSALTAFHVNLQQKPFLNTPLVRLLKTDQNFHFELLVIFKALDQLLSFVGNPRLGPAFKRKRLLVTPPSFGKLLVEPSSSKMLALGSRHY